MMYSYVLPLIRIVLTLAVVLVAVFLARRSGPEALVAIYTGLIVTASITATKIVTLFGVAVPAAVIVYSGTFLITDILAENYGKEKARLAVRSGVLVLILFALYTAVTEAWEPAPFYKDNAAYSTIVGRSIRITVAGLIAFWLSQLWDIMIFHVLKKRHGPERLWIRNNVSTASSQLIDTVVFISIAFWGLFPILPLILGQFAVKLIIAALDTPFLYVARRILQGHRSKRSINACETM